MAVPFPTPIFHITPIENLAEIIRAGGLHCNGTLAGEGVRHTSIAHANIQDRRASTAVPCGSGGNLHDYVPFYFAPRSPMLCAISHSQVQCYKGGQEGIMYLVSTAQAVAEAKLAYVFTDGHGTMQTTDFFDNLEDLDRVDWEVMNLKYWNDTPKDPDRKRRRSAEFLVHEFFPFSLVSSLAVLNATAQDGVLAVLGRGADIELAVKRGWYF